MIGATIQAAAVGTWCSTTRRSLTTRGPYDLFIRDRRLFWREVRAGPMDGRGYSSCRSLVYGSTVIALRFMATLLSWPCGRECAAFLGLLQILANLHRSLCQGAHGDRTRGVAGWPIRHRPEQYASRPVHVWRRRRSCGHESSFQRDDETVRRSRASRRECGRYHLACVARRLDFGCERTDDPLGNREFAGKGRHHHRSRPCARPVVVMDVSTDGRRRRGRAA